MAPERRASRSQETRQLNDAFSLFNEGGGIRYSASETGLVHTTFRRRVLNLPTRREASERRQKLTKYEEDFIVAWILDEEAAGRAPSKKYTAGFAERVLQSRSPSETLGRNWIEGFIRRHKDIRTKVGRAVHPDRVKTVRADGIPAFYRSLQAVRARKNIQPANEANMDEVGVQEGQSDNSTVLGTSRTNRVYRKTGQSTSWVTILESITALGRRLTPAVIFTGQTVQAQWFNPKITPWKYTSTSSGWSNTQIAERWLDEIYLPETAPADPDQWRLLILDGHRTHISEKFMWTAYTSKVYLLYLPAHTSDKLQPCDVGPFRPLKLYYTTETRQLMTQYATAPIYKRWFLDCYQRASEKAFSRHNVESGWKNTGIYPFQPDLVMEDESRLPHPPKPAEKEPDSEENTDMVFTTPRKSADLQELVRLAQQQNNVQFDRAARVLFQKAGRAIDRNTTRIAELEYKMEVIQRRLDAERPDVRTTVQTNPNQVFSDLPNIKRAQQKQDEAVQLWERKTGTSSRKTALEVKNTNFQDMCIEFQL
ncbi:transposase [Apiospora phragmitis]|uniref:Transposase n=1 Tax=Apiospora phragmitis TaxID=2905665 RepID=A0ABR1VPZ4_9PEZI